MFKKLLMIVATVILLPVTASAVPVGVGDLTGFRSTSTAGVVAADGWSGTLNAGFMIAWDIDPIVGGWHYSYALTDATENALTKKPSHLILEVSDNFTAGDISNASPSVDGGGPNTYGSGGSNPDIPGNIFGIKFNFPDNGPFTVSFDSTRAPMWGDFYTKDGQEGGGPNDVWATAWNTGFGTEPTSSTTNFTNWVPVPDTQTVVPEPATLLLLGSGLMGMGWFGRKRMKNRDRES